jgi:hypothetical protein
MLSASTSGPEGVAYVRFGSKGDMCIAKRHVCFTPQKRTCALQLVSCGPDQEILFGGPFQLAVHERETATSVPRCRQQDQ